MKRKTTGYPQADASLAQPVHDDDLAAMAGGAISGQEQARKLLDDYLASLDILSRRADLSDDARSALRTSLTATLARKINNAVSLTPAS